MIRCWRGIIDSDACASITTVLNRRAQAAKNGRSMEQEAANLRAALDAKRFEATAAQSGRRRMVDRWSQEALDILRAALDEVSCAPEGPRDRPP